MHYARSANAIDENRKVSSASPGRVEEGVEVREGPHPLIQLWFAGNHSDIGGSFAEAEFEAIG